MGSQGRVGFNQGWTAAKFLLANERSGIAAVARSRRGIEKVREIASTELGDDSAPLLKDPMFKRKVAELEIDLLALEYTELRTLAEKLDAARANAIAQMDQLARQTERGRQFRITHDAAVQVLEAVASDWLQLLRARRLT